MDPISIAQTVEWIGSCIRWQQLFHIKKADDHDDDEFERYRSMITQYLKRDILS
jgi:hypothetical protein